MYIYDSFDGLRYEYEYIGPYLSPGDYLNINDLINVKVSYNGTPLTRVDSDPGYGVMDNVYYFSGDGLVRENGTINLSIDSYFSNGSGYHRISIPKHVISITKIEAKYIGPAILKYNTFSKDDIKVKVIYNDSSKNKTLNSDEFEINSNIATTSPIYQCVISYNGKTTSVDIPVIYIKYIEAKYTGSYVFRNTKISKDDIKVKVIYNNSSYNKTLNSDEFELNNDIAINIPEHICTVIYNAYDNKEIFTDDVIIPVLYVIKVSAEYTGPIIMIGDKYSRNDVILKIEYSDSSYNKIIPKTEYNILNVTVTEEPVQTFTIEYKDQVTQELFYPTYDVPVLKVIEIIPKYTGGEIYIVGEFSKNEIEVYAKFNYSSYDRYLNQNEFDINSNIVNKYGINIFYATELISNINYRLTSSFEVIGLRILLDIRATYIGPEVSVSDYADKQNIHVYIDVTNEQKTERQTIKLKDDEYSLKDPGLFITNIGDNIRTIVYEDYKYHEELNITIPGIKKLINFNTEYIGPTRIIGEIVSKNEVIAYSTYLLDIIGNTETIELSSTKWDFYDYPIINDINKGFIRTKYLNTTFISNITVPYEIITDLRLLSWYEGPPIQVNHLYNYDDVVVLLVYKNGNRRRLKPYDVIFSDQVVHINGWNFYTVYYKTDLIILKQWYAVPGYIPIVYKKHDFKVIYIDVKNNFEETDYTEEFEEKFTYMNFFCINWKRFLDKVNELQKYGLYIMTAPKLCGLSNRWDQDWDVLCLTDHTLKANIVYTYLEEE